MLPAHQRLEAGDAAEVEVDDRLVVQDQLLVLDRALELLAAIEPGQRVDVHVVGEDRVAVGAGGLGGVHREVGVAQQVVAGLGGGDADAGAQVQALALEHHGRGEHLEQALDEHLGLARAAGEDRELVAAQAGDGVVGAQRVAQPLAADLEQAVAGGVAERVVDLLEVVEVEEGDHRGLARGERLGDPLLEQRAVRQAGQRVLEREPLQLVVAQPAAAGAVEQREQRGEADDREQRARRSVPIHDSRSALSASCLVAVGGGAQPVADALEVDAACRRRAARSKSRARISANSSSICGR